VREAEESENELGKGTRSGRARVHSRR